MEDSTVHPPPFTSHKINFILLLLQCTRTKNVEIYFLLNVYMETYETIRAIIVIFCVFFLYFINYYLLLSITYWWGPVCIYTF